MTSTCAALVMAVVSAFTINPPAPTKTPPNPTGYMQYPVPTCSTPYSTYKDCRVPKKPCDEKH